MFDSVVLIINSGSGHDDKAAARALIVERLREAGRRVDIVDIGAGTEIRAACRKIIAAAKAENRLLVAAGGDGTVNAVAAICLEHGAALGIVPLGTFNYFARDMGIPVRTAEAVDLLLAGRETRAAVGMVGDRLFLNNASFGAYARIVRNREADKSHFGRFRLVALVSEVRSLLTPARIFHVRVDTGAAARQFHTTMIFAGINKVQLETLGLSRSDVGRDKMSVTVLKPASAWEKARLLARGLAGTVPRDDRIEVFFTGGFTADAPDRTVSCVVDGEIVRLPTPLDFRVLPAALRVIAPVPPEAP